MATEGKLDFARKHLKRHGWSEGKGLGKEERGISKAIKVTIKTDHGGVGYNIDDQFSFHWWDHVFNKTARSISVHENQDGEQLVKCTEVSSDPVSNKRPNKNTDKPLLYGRFVKASNQSSDCYDSEIDSDQEKDFSHRCPEEKLFQACGGRTAHKAARHGFRLNGKLQRVEEQEKMDFSCYSSKRNSPQCSPTHTLFKEEERLVVEQKEQTSESRKEDKERTKQKRRRREMWLNMDKQATSAGVDDGKQERKERKKKRKDMSGTEKDETLTGKQEKKERKKKKKDMSGTEKDETLTGKQEKKERKKKKKDMSGTEKDKTLTGKQEKKERKRKKRDISGTEKDKTLTGKQEKKERKMTRKNMSGTEKDETLTGK